MTGQSRAHDALLLLSFGGPEQPEDVLRFLENVTRGKGVPAERLVEVGEHYYRFGGKSPINDQCRDLLGAVRHDFDSHGLADVPIYWGNRNWDPLLTDTVRQMADDGRQRVAVLVTSAYASYSGCRQYRENLYDAVQALGDVQAGSRRLTFSKLRHYFDHPGFVRANADAVEQAWRKLPAATRGAARLVFVTHSIPVTMNASSGPDGGAYAAQHTELARAVAGELAARTGADLDADLVYCSRSGPPHVPWLEPDVNDHLKDLSGKGVESVVLAPIGFVSDHMEVAFDLDVEAAQTARDLGMAVQRAATAGVHPAFVAGIRDLFVERDRVEAGLPVDRQVQGGASACWDVCQAHCCPNPRADRPALCEEST